MATASWLRFELLAVMAVATAVFLSVPLTMGRLGLGWDTLNHHIYLGWMAENGRQFHDYFAAGGQSAQFPWLYWPVYKLAVSGASGVVAGSVLALLHLVTVPPVWMVARTLIPGENLQAAIFRACAVALAFMSAVPLKTLEATGNDLLAAAPFLWSFALALASFGQARPGRRAFWAGVLGGVAVAFKLSNGPLVVLVPLVFLFAPHAWSVRARTIAAFCAGSVAGFLVTYGPWGYDMWRLFGNPVFPFADGAFALLRDAVGWRR
ncbi:hypothetical protein [Ramlibacter sp.]|uniref:hypothetical protein n=1 Tax=Ramlibacter sp. TaxID=1917967 RepID=UPI003D0D4FCD